MKLLDCDTISQAKEKIMDVLYRSVKVSDRHGIATVDLEYKVQPKDSITLRDDDKSSLVDGSWKRINTLKHYKVRELLQLTNFLQTSSSRPAIVLRSLILEF